MAGTARPKTLLSKLAGRIIVYTRPPEIGLKPDTGMRRAVRKILGRLASIDITDLARPLPPVVSQLLFGVACAVVVVTLRMLTDIYLPGAGPFALSVPVVLVATLFGRWFAGAVCLTLSGLHAWYYVLPITGSFSFEHAGDGPRVFVNLAAGYVSVALAEIFRRTARSALREREMLLVELEHRVKNNLASLSSIIRMQMRDASPEGRELMQGLIGRVESFARAYGYLRFQFDGSGSVVMSQYLGDLVQALEQSATHDRRILFEARADDTAVARNVAIVVGLLVNEVATNSIKHAFPAGRGKIEVKFKTQDRTHELTIADNGKGMDTDAASTGIGRRLIDALAQQAGGSVDVTTGPTGTSYVIAFPAK